MSVQANTNMILAEVVTILKQTYTILDRFREQGQSSNQQVELQGRL